MSLIDPRTGKTKRRVGRLSSSQLKSLVTYSISDNGAFLVGVEKSGDLLAWVKDTNEIRAIEGLSEFALKLFITVNSPAWLIFAFLRIPNIY